MRVITKSIPLLFFVILLVVGAFFGVREYFLNKGIDTMRASLRELVKAGRSGIYITECQNNGLQAGGQAPPTAQLRFTSSTEYVLEILCHEFSFESLIIGSGSLPQYVKKVPGTSGFVYKDAAISGIALEVFGDVAKSVDETVGRPIPFISRRIAVMLQGSTVKVAAPDALPQANSGPVTSCTGYGYFCCQNGVQQGVGSQITGLTECKTSCYSQCVAQPIVLSFNPNPFFIDSELRIVSVPSGSAVEFVVVSDMSADAKVTALFNFGDGKTEERGDLATPVSHVYSCAQPSCEFTASVRLTNDQGVESSETGISKMKIMVE